MTLCLTARFDGGMLLAADTAGTWRVPLGQGRWRLDDADVKDQRKLYQVGDCLVAMAGNHAHKLREAIEVAQASPAQAYSEGPQEAARALSEHLRAEFSRHDLGEVTEGNTNEWNCLVCGVDPRFKKARAYRVRSTSDFAIDQTSRSGAIGTAEVAGAILSALFGDELMSRNDATACLRATIGLSSLMYGECMIGGEIEVREVRDDGTISRTLSEFIEESRLACKRMLRGKALDLIKQRLSPGT